MAVYGELYDVAGKEILYASVMWGNEWHCVRGHGEP